MRRNSIGVLGGVALSILIFSLSGCATSASTKSAASTDVPIPTSSAVPPSQTLLAEGATATHLWWVTGDGLLHLSDATFGSITTPEGLDPKTILDAAVVHDTPVLTAAVANGAALDLFVDGSWSRVAIEVPWASGIAETASSASLFDKGDQLGLLLQARESNAVSSTALYTVDPKNQTHTLVFSAHGPVWRFGIVNATTNDALVTNGTAGVAYWEQDRGARWIPVTFDGEDAGGQTSLGAPQSEGERLYVPVTVGNTTAVQSATWGGQFSVDGASIPSTGNSASDSVAGARQDGTWWALTAPNHVQRRATTSDSWRPTSSRGLMGAPAGLFAESASVAYTISTESACVAFKSECGVTTYVEQTVDGGATWTALAQSQPLGTH